MSTLKHRVFIGLGSNLENPQQQVSAAMAALDALPESRLLQSSSLYVSAPVGYADQPDFVNAAALIETDLSAEALLQALLELEQQFGRVRTFLNAPRTLLLELLLKVRQQVPHPRMHERAFVLMPLAEIDPELLIPGKGRLVDWLAHCGEQPVHRLN